MPFLLSIGFVELEQGKQVPVFDLTYSEWQSVDAVLHICIDESLKLHGIQVTDGELSIGMLSEKNLTALLTKKVQEYAKLYN